MPARRRFGLLKRLLLLAFGLGLGILLAEAVLRVVGLASPSPYQPDLICGSRLKPNYAGWQTQEGRVFFQTNSAGFRDREHAVNKPADTLRVVVLGDSYCEALQVELEQTFWAVCQRELNACDPVPGKKIEVLNAGVSGYGTAQELLMLRHHLSQYDPDVVILAFLTGNDIRNNSRELETDLLKPFFIWQDEKLVLDDSFRQQPFFTSKWIRFKDKLITSSRLMTLLYRIKHRRETAPQSATAGAELGLDDFIYAEPTQPVHREAWQLTERVIEQMHKETQAKDATLVVVTLTNGIQIHPDRAKRDAFAAKLGVPDLTYADRRVAEFAKQLGCKAITLVDRMAAHAEQHQVYLHGFENTQLGEGHWNVEGHRLAGEILAAELCRDRTVWTKKAAQSRRGS